MSTDNMVKRQAIGLGYLGIIPFLGVALLYTDIPQEQVVNGIHSYAAIILTFIGAIHWGRVLNPACDTKNTFLMTLSVIPSLIAWLSLLLPPLQGLLILITAFLALIVFDIQQYSELAWFRKLRIQLTSIVCLMLILTVITIL